MSYAKPANSVKVKRGRSKTYNPAAGLVAFTGSVTTKRKSIKSSFGPATHSSNLGFSSGILGGPTSPALAFPLMSASSSLSSSLSFLMQSKYSFCLSRAWPHTRENTRERRRGRGEVGLTLDRHATPQDIFPCTNMQCAHQANNKDIETNNTHRRGQGYVLTGDVVGEC